jgi:hypothetical protein
MLEILNCVSIMGRTTAGNRFLVYTFVICLSWTVFVHLIYFLTLNDDPFESWMRYLEGTSWSYLWVAFLFLQFLLVPFGLFFGLISLRQLWPAPRTFGSLAGLMVGLWANTQLLTVSYCGAYVSLPGIIVGSYFSGGQNTGPLYFLPAFASNLLIWTGVGCLAGPLFVKYLPCNPEL